MSMHAMLTQDFTPLSKEAQEAKAAAEAKAKRGAFYSAVHKAVGTELEKLGRKVEYSKVNSSWDAGEHEILRKADGMEVGLAIEEKTEGYSHPRPTGKFSIKLSVDWQYCGRFQLSKAGEFALAKIAAKIQFELTQRLARRKIQDEHRAEQEIMKSRFIALAAQAGAKASDWQKSVELGDGILLKKNSNGFVISGATGSEADALAMIAALRAILKKS